MLADLDALPAYGVADPTVRPDRGPWGEFLVTAAVPALVQGSVIVGDVPAGAGAAVALPSVYVAHLEGCLRRVAAATTAGEVRALPWPFDALVAAVDDAHRRTHDGWEPLGRLDDQVRLWPGWGDALVTRRGFRVAAPWQMGNASLGYGRWLPSDMLEHVPVRDDGLRTLELDADRLVSALTWHGVQARRDDARLSTVLVGWSSRLPLPVVSPRAGHTPDVVVLPDAPLPIV